MIKYRGTTLSKVTDTKSLEEAKVVADLRVDGVRTLPAKQWKHVERVPSLTVDGRISYSSNPKN